jgi:hypothetical protein
MVLKTIGKEACGLRFFLWESDVGAPPPMRRMGFGWYSSRPDHWLLPHGKPCALAQRCTVGRAYYFSVQLGGVEVFAVGL